MNISFYEIFIFLPQKASCVHPYLYCACYTYHMYTRKTCPYNTVPVKAKNASTNASDDINLLLFFVHSWLSNSLTTCHSNLRNFHSSGSMVFMSCTASSSLFFASIAARNARLRNSVASTSAKITL